MEKRETRECSHGSLFSSRLSLADIREVAQRKKWGKKKKNLLFMIKNITSIVLVCFITFLLKIILVLYWECFFDNFF